RAITSRNCSTHANLVVSEARDRLTSSKAANLPRKYAVFSIVRIPQNAGTCLALRAAGCDGARMKRANAMTARGCAGRNHAAARVRHRRTHRVVGMFVGYGYRVRTGSGVAALEHDAEALVRRGPRRAGRRRRRRD